DLGALGEVAVAVGEGEEARLVLGGSEIDAPVEGGPEEFPEGFEVGFLHRVDVVDLALVEEEAEHGADAMEDEIAPEFAQGAAHGFLEGAADLLETVPAVEALHFPELGEPGGEGEGIARERAGLVDGSERREMIHDLRLSAEGADGEPPADDFAH